MFARFLGVAALTMVTIGSAAASMSADVEVPAAVAINGEPTAPIGQTSPAPALACAIDLAKDLASVSRLGMQNGRSEVTTVVHLGCKNQPAVRNAAPSVWSVLWNVLRDAASHLLDALAYSFRV